jgi:hypothetical protein
MHVLGEGLLFSLDVHPTVFQVDFCIVAIQVEMNVQGWSIQVARCCTNYAQISKHLYNRLRH